MYRNLLLSTQRKMHLRVASAYRTGSSEYLQVITGIVPIDLQLQERKKMYDERMGEAGRDGLRASTIEEWHQRGMAPETSHKQRGGPMDQGPDPEGG